MLGKRIDPGDMLQNEELFSDWGSKGHGTKNFL
jgi:hypothetical protein